MYASIPSTIINQIPVLASKHEGVDFIKINAFEGDSDNEAFCLTMCKDRYIVIVKDKRSANKMYRTEVNVYFDAQGNIIDEEVYEDSYSREIGRKDSYTLPTITEAEFTEKRRAQERAYHEALARKMAEEIEA